MIDEKTYNWDNISIWKRRGIIRTTVSIDYTKSIAATGGIPIVLPVTDDRTIIKAQLSLIDGLILSGGTDINPLLYGQDFKAGIGTVSPERDNYEMIVLETSIIECIFWWNFISRCTIL